MMHTHRVAVYYSQNTLNGAIIYEMNTVLHLVRLETHNQHHKLIKYVLTKVMDQLRNHFLTGY